MIACNGHEIIMTNYVQNNENEQKKKVHHGSDCESAWCSWFGNTIVSKAVSSRMMPVLRV